MSKNKKALVNENVIRRWGKLANMQPLTENWLGEQDADEDEFAAAEDEMAAGEAEVEAGEEAEASIEETEAVERIVTAVVDAIADETGVAIEVEEEADDEGAMDDMDAGMDASDELDDDADAEMDAADAANRRMAYNRRDIDEKKKPAHKNTRSQRDADEGHFATKDKDKKKGEYGDGSMKKKDGKVANRKDETLNLDVIDDEELTEAVLTRVVERLLRRK